MGKYFRYSAKYIIVFFLFVSQHYVIKFVSDLRQVDDFLRFPPPIKLTATLFLLLLLLLQYKRPPSTN